MDYGWEPVGDGLASTISSQLFVHSGNTAFRVAKNGMFESQERGILVLDEQANGMGWRTTC